MIADSVLLPAGRCLRTPAWQQRFWIWSYAMPIRGDMTAQRFLLRRDLGFWCELGGLDATAISERCSQRGTPSSSGGGR
jgi:hypothetical protein